LFVSENKEFNPVLDYEIPEKTIALVQNPDEDEEIPVENPPASNSRWNPTDLVAKMYKLQAIVGNQVLN